MTPRSQFYRADLVRLLAIPDPAQRARALDAVAEPRPPVTNPDALESPPLPAAPRADDRSDPVDVGVPATAAAVPFWRAIRYERLAELPGRDGGGRPRRGAISRQPDGAYDRPAGRPLWTKAELLTALRKHSQTVRVGGDWDFGVAVDRLSRCEQLTPLPLRRKRSWGSALQVVLDRSVRLTPYWHDQDLAVRWLSTVYPRDRIFVARSGEGNGSFRVLSPQGRSNYSPPPAGTPVV
ncbi:MAG TPA: hypothetical protein VH092_25125, partial [Urbifossiella sp.]|nr:hypothetical protein [Urbifossiella sp.]